MLFLGVDCANKSLALCVINYYPEWQQKHTEIYKSFMESEKKLPDFIKTFKLLNALYDKVFEIKYLQVFDLIPGKNLKESTLLERTMGLKNVLKNIDLLYPDIKTVFIEYQMNANDKSRAVFSNTYYHFVDRCKTIPVGPSLKNTIAFTRELRHSNFIEKYSKAYTANKNHAKANLTYWLKLFDKQPLLENISKKNYDDAADAFLTIVGFMITNPGLGVV